MKWVRDTTGRFNRRPYYEQTYLDERCERLLFEFLNELYGQVTVPVPTGALLKLIERDAKELDVYADLSTEGEGIHGVTYFDPPRKPRVRIARELFVESRRAHRLRTTLAHEYGHVRIHAPLYEQDGSAKWQDHKCKGDELLPLESKVDWMEWQASYAAAAFLMPVSRLTLVVDASVGKRGITPLTADSSSATDLKQRVSEAFDVSEDAAAVRLSQLGYLASRSQ
jgi:hypothetical protein